MCKNIVEPDRSQMTRWGMLIVCWIPKATNIHSEYIITYCFSTATMVMRTHLSVTLYVRYIAYLVSSIELICYSIIVFYLFYFLKKKYSSAYSEYSSFVFSDNLKDSHCLLVRYVWHRGISYKIYWYVYVCFMSLIFIFSKSFRLVVAPMQPPIQRAPLFCAGDIATCEIVES
jgi:hypothetical protein